MRETRLVRILSCGHVAHEGSSRLCPHLMDPEAVEAGVDYLRLLRGRVLDHDLCCVSCDPRSAADGQVELGEACEGCVARARDGGSCVGWRGQPQIPERPEPVSVARKMTALPQTLGPIVDFTAICDGARSLWLLLTDQRRIALLNAETGEMTMLATHSVPGESGRQPWAGRVLRQRLHASSDGRFAAVVNDYGRYGQVIDLGTGAVTMEIDGGDYHPDTVPFSLTFAQCADRTVVMHRTAWNRLDVSSPASGLLLTGREPAHFEHGEGRPPHYLDYFHGALHLSPTGQWLADDGWVWHPVGMPVTWDLHAWLDANVWESEDGPTRRRLCLRDYHWDTPMCWIDPTHLAVSGLGDYDEAMLPGVRIFDVTTGDEVRAFAGPTGALFADRERLYSVTDDTTHVWDPATGERTAALAGVNPTRRHPGTGELAAITASHLVRWTTTPQTSR